MSVISLDKTAAFLTAKGLELRSYESVPSTNTLLREFAEEGAAHGKVVLASSQSAGRGRTGRSFFSPGDSGLYMSVLLRAPLPIETAMLITPAAAVAVCRAIEDVSGAETGIKWVNDVLIGGRKVCGILTEASSASDGTLKYAVLGVGINVLPPEGGFPDEIAQLAGSVFDRAVPDARERLAAAVLDRFFEIWPALGVGRFVDEYRRRSVLTGREINVITPSGVRPAFAVGIDDSCRLLVRYPDGWQEALSTGEVSVRARQPG